jgi:hypothetical protein
MGGRGGAVKGLLSEVDVVLIYLSWGRGESDQLLIHGLLADWCPLPCTRCQMLTGCSWPLVAGSWLAAALMAAPGHSCPLLAAPGCSWPLLARPSDCPGCPWLFAGCPWLFLAVPWLLPCCSWLRLPPSWMLMAVPSCSCPPPGRSWLFLAAPGSLQAAPGCC